MSEGTMKYWEKFKTFKQRGDWVELQFMAAAAQRRFIASKPWGDTQAYDVGIEHEGNYLRVQVKSTTMRSGAGYLCQFKPNHQKKHDYSVEQIDLFAAYVIPENAWYLIPAVLLLGKRRKCMAMLCPVVRPAKKASYCYERYREAWNLLRKSRNELLECGPQDCRPCTKREGHEFTRAVSAKKSVRRYPLRKASAGPRPRAEVVARTHAPRKQEMPTIP